jgi:hypothetical protein
MLIREYMARLDGDDPRSAMDLVEPDIAFLLVIPTGKVGGTSREELWGYVSRRPAVVRRHHVLRTTSDGDFESVYGLVTDDGVETGAFHASARLSPEGRMQRYLVYFDPDFRLFDAAEPDGS